jgi:acetyl esterase
MNWKIKLVLWFTSLRKPAAMEANMSISELRKKSDKAAALGTFLFDKKTSIKKITDADANGITVRIYNNSDEAAQRVIVYYHGGGFVLYGLYSHDYICRRLCKMNNCIVVSVDYRLAPEHTYPAAHDDAFNTLKWVIVNVGLYGGNSNNIVVAGDSAGGNLAACMAHRCLKEGIVLKAQVLVYPWIDGQLNNPSITKNGKGYLLEKETMFWFQQQYTPRLEDRCVPGVSPCYEKAFSGLAPAFILTAQYDPLRDDGLKYYEQLKTGGSVAQYREYDFLFHGFFNLPGVHKNAMQAYNDIRDFLSEV